MYKNISKLCAIALLCVFLPNNRLEASMSETPIYTPRGSAVNHVHGKSAIYGVQYYRDYVENTFPNAILILDSTPAYNCHGYAWADSHGWIGDSTHVDEDVYWTDGSYEETTAALGSHVSYRHNDHSAKSVGGGWVRSKWGRGALVLHELDHDPYDIIGEESIFVYYKLAPIPIPDAPDSLILASSEGTNPLLSWIASDWADNYKVYKGSSLKATVTSTSWTDNTEIVDYDREVGYRSYYVKAVNTTGTSAASNTLVVSVEEEPFPKMGAVLPKEFALSQNYPNPFNPVTSIRYALPESQHVILRVFNITGQMVATLVNETKSPGYHDVQWDASSMASGVYIYTISAGSFSETKKMVVMK